MFLADIDGDGCSDLIYVDSHRVLCWINTAGSQLSEPIEIFGTPLGCYKYTYCRHEGCRHQAYCGLILLPEAGKPITLS